MVNKEKFNELFEKYRSGRLTPAEYQQLLTYLQEPGMETELDLLLNQYWKNMVLEEVADKPEVRDPQKYKRVESLWNWGIAASLLLLFGLFFYYAGMPDILKKQEVVYQTGFGERVEINLNDGSVITLNANSELRWNEDWENSGIRQAELEGEAFFEVEKQEGYKFTVRTDDVAVEVLGTSFNIDSRQDKTEVYLDEGEVNLKLRQKYDNNGSGIQPEKTDEHEILMKPGELVLYDSKSRKLQKNKGQSLITAAAWKNNVLNFKNMKFSEVLNLLRDIYGQSFECSDAKLLNTPMYLGVPYSDWEAVRQALELSLNIEFEKTANRRYVVRTVK